ncbi:MAG: AraC-like DNA-binding protein, partial [Paraglaciecola sp.]
RIRHAKTLLQDPENTHWPVVVVGMESGFASVGPFTRAFKSNSGMTPNQYRQDYQTQSKNCRASLHG